MPFLEFPKMVYHSKTGASKIVNSKEEEVVALKSGHQKQPVPPPAPVELAAAVDKSAELDAREASLNDREDALNVREKDLMAREAALKAK